MSASAISDFKATQKIHQRTAISRCLTRPACITPLLPHRSSVSRLPKQLRKLRSSLRSITPSLSLINQSNAVASATEEKRPIAARAPFSDGDRDLGVGKSLPGVLRASPRKSRRAKQGRILLLQSALYSKQVITRTSGRNLGVVCQLWVDTVKWDVVALSVKPSILFGEEDTILLSSLRQVGDVLLVHDETAVEENVSLEQLGYCNIVGSEVVSENGVYLGKIRDFKFDPEDGAIASLVFDGLGLSIVPSTVVSTYEMGIAEVLSAGPDRIIVRDSTASRVKRLSMGILEKLSLAEPPWKQDDVLYSTYAPPPVPRPQRRPPSYETAPRGRPETSGRVPSNSYSRAPAYDYPKASGGTEPRAAPAYVELRTPAYEPPRTPAYEPPRTPVYGVPSERPRGRGDTLYQDPRRQNEPQYSGDRGAPYSGMAQSQQSSPQEVSERGGQIQGRYGEGASTFGREASSREETTGQRPVERESSPGRFRGAAFGARGKALNRVSEGSNSERASDWNAAVERYPEQRWEVPEPVYLERGVVQARERGGVPVARRGVERTRTRGAVQSGEPVFVERDSIREDVWKADEPVANGGAQTAGPFFEGRSVRGLGDAAFEGPRIGARSDESSGGSARPGYGEELRGSPPVRGAGEVRGSFESGTGYNASEASFSEEKRMPGSPRNREPEPQRRVMEERWASTGRPGIVENRSGAGSPEGERNERNDGQRESAMNSRLTNGTAFSERAASGIPALGSGTADRRVDGVAASVATEGRGRFQPDAPRYSQPTRTAGRVEGQSGDGWSVPRAPTSRPGLEGGVQLYGASTPSDRSVSRNGVEKYAGREKPPGASGQPYTSVSEATASPSGRRPGWQGDTRSANRALGVGPPQRDLKLGTAGDLDATVAERSNPNAVQERAGERRPVDGRDEEGNREARWPRGPGEGLKQFLRRDPSGTASVTSARVTPSVNATGVEEANGAARPFREWVDRSPRP
ncbi:hypothetical protein KFL_000320480 [Klebsormidium nitens]|uniref:PRC-barrel domain-containing protein n=1 Tax=Klebsormidium nitens TaxID=105231 RepID=A0A1Y1HLQ4_KLENI|nr:hypothetical protein KFL_000320480 [Klebsormidium nitens]|eukprot:GAQ79550.1 hypothetical protein KFL_000320480 [Klebsormidium nitens]